MNEAEILKSLDDSQRKAVEYITGPSLVIAGAGAGKTRVLTSKIAFLIARGYKPWNILALTFTNKAANEMRGRIGGLVGEQLSRYVVMGTFHSVFSRILRKESGRIGYTPDYTIYDKTDSQNLIKRIVRSNGLDPKVYKASVISSRISWAKNNLILPSDYTDRRDLRKTDESNGLEALYKIYDRYQQNLKSSDCMDFDDLLINMLKLLSVNEDLRIKYSDRYKFVLVDEFQDTNMIQARILWQLTKDTRKLCVVGDDAQSIYAFRGADINNILSFNRTFPEAELFKLERNYRSTANIVEAASSVISHNVNRIPKDIYSLEGKGSKIDVLPAVTDRDEAGLLADKIESIIKNKGIKRNEIAILYRRNSQSRVIEEELRSRAIPYRIFGGLSFYERKEIKDVLAYFRLVINHNDNEALHRIINYPARGIGNKSLDKISSLADSRNVSVWDIITGDGIDDAGISTSVLKKIRNFVSMIEGFSARIDTEDAYHLGKDIIYKSGIMSEFSNDVDDIVKKENIEELLAALSDFCNSGKEGTDDNSGSVSLSDYIANVSLLSDLDVETEDNDRITLMTIHSAKGLEYDAVLLSGAEDEIIPGNHSFYDPKEIEEERRLFYVALTRAKKICCISYSHYRYSYGNLTESEPCRFIGEIKTSCVEYEKGKRVGNDNASTRIADVQKPFFTVKPTATMSYRRLFSEKEESVDEARSKNGEILRKGSRVEHHSFGEGSVVSLINAGDTVKAKINFDKAGEKELLLKFAPLRLVK